jgi:dihydroorotase
MKLASLIALSATLASAQNYDLILRGGHVIDPANSINGVMDVAVAGGKIAAVGRLAGATARKTIDAGGLYVVPGLVDLHVHVFGYSGSMFPDDTSLVTGATTVVDCGGAGWRTFDEFKKKIIDTAATRVLAFINIVGAGMVGTTAENNVEDMDPVATAEKMKQYPDLIVGIKTAHFSLPGYTAVKRAVEAGRLSGKPVIVDSSILSNTGRNAREKLLDILRPGDIHTHTYNDRHIDVVDRFGGRLTPHVVEARRRGVLFDLGHGSGSFLWPAAVAAMRQGFAPDTISTDLHSSSILGPQSDMPNSMSKLMHLGMKIEDAVERATAAPARAIKRFPEVGTLGVGRNADIAVLELQQGVFAFKDAWVMKNLARQRLENVLTVRAGKIVFDRDGRGYPVWSTAGEYGVIE